MFRDARDGQLAERGANSEIPRGARDDRIARGMIRVCAVTKSGAQGSLPVQRLNRHSYKTLIDTAKE